MSPPPRIYLDNAATSWPKPEAVYSAVDHCLRNLGASAGRSAYSGAVEAQRIVANARASCAKVLGIRNPSRLVFTSNGTAALNLAIHGFLQPGDQVVTTVCEHNSVLRPLRLQASRNGVHVNYAECDEAGYVSPKAIAALITADTRLVVVTHASNVTGAIQPIEAIAAECHQRNVPLLVDGAQTAGCLPVDLEASEIDLFACGGHKGMLGPLGTGLLYIRPGLDAELQPLSQGGTGTDSFEDVQPDSMPERYESGNLNVPALAGLGAAAEFLEKHAVAAIHNHSMQHCSRILAELDTMAGIRCFGPRGPQNRVAVVSFQASGYDPQELAMAWEATGGVEVRAGLHCAPRMHRALGTLDSGGLVRVSPGLHTSVEEIDSAMESLRGLTLQ